MVTQPSGFGKLPELISLPISTPLTRENLRRKPRVETGDLNHMIADQPRTHGKILYYLFCLVSIVRTVTYLNIKDTLVK